MELTKGMKAPEFCLRDQDDTEVCLKNLKGRWVVAYFYPKDDTPGCTIEAIEFSGLSKEFDKSNAVVLGISPDSGKRHCNFIEKHGLQVQLLTDPDKKAIKQYGAWGKKMMYGKEVEGVIRSTVLIDPQGRVAHHWSNVAPKGHGAEVLGILKRLC